jgi:hypothetical protein
MSTSVSVMTFVIDATPKRVSRLFGTRRSQSAKP